MKDRFTYKGKKAYFGVADLRDGQIEQVVNYKTAKDWDCHHSFMFRKALVCKIDDGVCVTFWIEGNQIPIFLYFNALHSLNCNCKIDIVLCSRVKRIFRLYTKIDHWFEIIA